MIKNIKCKYQPFQFFLKENYINSYTFSKLNKYIKSSNIKWFLYSQESYKYYISPLTPTSKNIRLFNIFFNKKFVKMLESEFNISGLKCTDITLHKMKKGHYTYRHSDNNDFGEVVRLTLMISKPYAYNGGEFIIYNNKKIFKKIKIKNNTLFGFLMMETSFHEVKEVKRGQRINLIISYSKI